ncbi:MAG: carboxypeptidase M32 [Candidatus Thorarchaeota archaeon]|nr:MAG: carboxypeptidase M32 [Candidatus Thorarchaeota archaeon]
MSISAYERLKGKSRELLGLTTIGSILGWDFETYMPPKGVTQRGEANALLQKIGHRMLTAKDVGEILKEVEREQESLDEPQARDVYLFKKQYDEATKLPEELVAELARQQTTATAKWRDAKANADWKKFEPELEKTIELTKKRAELLMEVKDAKTLYDAMIDDYEPKMTQDVISNVFGELRNGLVPLVKKYSEISSGVDTSFLKVKVPIDIQRKLMQDLAEVVHYDVTSKEAGGRIDEAEHPFTTGYYDDVRVTVHYYEENVGAALFAMLHEAGHALYEQHLNQDWKYLPLGTSSSSGIHEAMSRFVENMVGRSPEFWRYYLPKLNAITDGQFSNVSLMEFVRASNLVKPSKIRVEADEVTYSLHIILRFEIERDLMAGKIHVTDLPSVWNEKYEKYLGVEIENDTEGVLQDIHWAFGYFGYFPSYALGNVYGGMLLEQLNKDNPEWLNEMAAGKFGLVKEWLTKSIYLTSNLYDPGDLAERVTGKKLTSKPFLAYIEEKYSSLYET